MKKSATPDNLILQKRPTVWISHRGVKKKYTENTLNAFEAAKNSGFNHLETDIRMTSDQQPVLFHDPDLHRLLGKKLKIASLSRAELTKLKLPCGQGLLFFETFMESFPALDWTFDVKPETGQAFVEFLQSWCAKKKSTDFILSQARFLFWDKRQALALKKVFPAAKVLASEPECWRAGLSALSGIGRSLFIKKGKTYSLPYSFSGLKLAETKLVKAYHDVGAKILGYLPSTDGEAAAFVEAGFDEILTDFQIVRQQSSKGVSTLK